MPYCTSTDLQNRLGADGTLRVFDRDGDGTADTAALTAAIAWADAVIDAKLQHSHGTPFTGSVAVLVRELSIDLAIYRIASGVPGATTSERSPYRQAYEDAMKLLADLARDREARLPSGAPVPVAGAEGYVSAPESPWGDLAAGLDRDGETVGGGF